METSNEFRHKDLFYHTLEDLKIKGIYDEDFDMEQLYYQIEIQVQNHFDEIETEINQKYKKFIAYRNNKEHSNDGYNENSSVNEISEEYSEDITSSCNSSNNQDKNNSESRECELNCSGDEEDGMQSYSDTEENLSSLGDDESESRESLEKSDDQSICYSEEASMSIESNLWLDSHSSDVELINKPSNELANALWRNRYNNRHK